MDTYHGSKTSFLISTNTLSGLFETKHLVVTVPSPALARTGQRTLSVQKANLQQNCPICQRQLDFSPKTSPCSMLVSQLPSRCCAHWWLPIRHSDCKTDVGRMWIKITQLLHNKTKELARNHLWNSCFHISTRDLEVLVKSACCPCPSKSHTAQITFCSYFLAQFTSLTAIQKFCTNTVTLQQKRKYLCKWVLLYLHRIVCQEQAVFAFEPMRSRNNIEAYGLLKLKSKVKLWSSLAWTQLFCFSEKPNSK